MLVPVSKTVFFLKIACLAGKRQNIVNKKMMGKSQLAQLLMVLKNLIFIQLHKQLFMLAVFWPVFKCLRNSDICAQLSDQTSREGQSGRLFPFYRQRTPGQRAEIPLLEVRRAVNRHGSKRTSIPYLVLLTQGCLRLSKAL